MSKLPLSFKASLIVFVVALCLEFLAVKELSLLAVLSLLIAAIGSATVVNNQPDQPLLKAMRAGFVPAALLFLVGLFLLFFGGQVGAVGAHLIQPAILIPAFAAASASVKEYLASWNI